MIIESIDIRRFGKLSDFKATFECGFNLVEGVAESGKSTLVAFIVYMLYGFPEETREALSERRHRTPWEGLGASGSMVFSAGGARYRAERTSDETERGFRDTYALYNLDTGLAEQGEVAPGERFLGVSRETFIDTALLSDVRRGGVCAEGVSDAIENMLFSGDARISSTHAARVLREAANELSSFDGASGAVSVLFKERDRQKEALAVASARERLHFEREEELFLTRKKIEEAEGEIEKFSRLETNYYNALMIEDYDRLHALEDASEARIAAIKAHADSYRVGDFLPDRSYLSALLDAKSETQGAEREAKDAEEAYALLPEGRLAVPTEERALMDRVEEAKGEDTLRHGVKENRKKAALLLTLAGVSCALFLLFTVLLSIALVKGTAGAAFGILAVVSLGGFALLLVEGLRARGRLLSLYAVCDAKGREDFEKHLRIAAEAKLRVSQATAEKERAALRLSRAKERLALAGKVLLDTLARWGVVPPDITRVEEQVAAVAERAECYLSENERLTAEHRAAEAEVQALRQKLKNENEIAVRARVAPDDRKRYRNQNAKDLRRGVELYTERLKSLRQNERALLDALAEEEHGERLAAIAERILALESRIALLSEQAEVLNEAREAIEGGEARLRAEISPRLGLDACRFLYEMTDGKYSELNVGGDYALSYDEGDGAREVGYLSDSTEDLAYYALRLSLLGLTYKETPPVCFDGCTARQDDERALSFLRAIRTLTEEGKQCIFFSSGARESALVKNVFSSYRHVKMPV